MASASFGCAGHVRPALWPRGCYCKHDWPQADVLGCQIYRFLAPPCRCSRSDTSAPSADTPHPTSYTQGWHTLPAVVLSAPAVGSHLFDCPGRTGRPTGGKVHTRNTGRSDCCHGLNFRGRAMLFFKSISELFPKGLFHCSSSIRRGAPKVNNQF